MAPVGAEFEGWENSPEKGWLEMPPDKFLQRWYAEQYSTNAYGSAAGWVQRKMHASLEKGIGAGDTYAQVLELGGNVGEHVPFVLHGYSEYVLTDLVNNLSSQQTQDLAAQNVNFCVADVQALPFKDQSFDRTVMTCVLHHLRDPETALNEMRRVTRHGGQIDLFLSSDPGAIFRFARWVGPYRSAHTSGLGRVKRLVDARDHVGHAGGLIRMIDHAFRLDEVATRTWPLPGMTWNSSLWRTYRIRVVSGSPT